MIWAFSRSCPRLPAETLLSVIAEILQRYSEVL